MMKIVLQKYGQGKYPEGDTFKRFTMSDMPFLEIKDFAVSHGKNLEVLDFPNPYEIEGKLECLFLEKNSEKVFQFFHGQSQAPAFWCSTKLNFDN